MKKKEGGLKGRFLTGFYRWSRSIYLGGAFLRAIGFPVRACYRFITSYCFHLDIADKTSIGENFVIWHGAHGSVINSNTKIGRNFHLRQNTTIGSSSFTDNSLCPTIEDNVSVGPNCCIFGKITIGHHSMIGGGSVVIHDVPPYSVVAGNPAKVLKSIEHNVSLEST